MNRPIAVALALSCLALGRPARAADPDPWWGKDKALHFSISIGLGSGGYAASALWAPERWQRAVAGAGFSLTLGAGKELLDLAGYGDPSWRDFTWDIAGTAAGVGVAYLLDLALFPRTTYGLMHDARRRLAGCYRSPASVPAGGTEPSADAWRAKPILAPIHTKLPSAYGLRVAGSSNTGQLHHQSARRISAAPCRGLPNKPEERLDL